MLDELLLRTIFSSSKPLSSFNVSIIKLGLITKKNNINGGNIPVYGGGDITFYTNTSNRNENTLIISKCALSKTCVRLISNKFYLNASGLSIHNKNNELQKYINYYLLSEKNQEYIYNNCTSGSIQRNLNMNIFNNLQIPIPNSEEKINEWVDKISKPYDRKIKKEQQLKELVLEIQNKIKNISENEECEEVEFNTLLKYLKKENKYKASDGKNENLYKILYSGNYKFENISILIGRGDNVSLHIASYFSVLHDYVYVLKFKK